MELRKSAGSNRLDYVDVYRALGIILMVMGHIGFGDIFDHFIHAFHMPMFFILSGFLYNTEKNATISIKQFVKKKAKALLIPYLAFSLIHIPVWLILEGFSYEPLLNLLLFSTKELPVADALWFLVALFVADITYFLLRRFIKNKFIFHGCVVVISVTGCLIKPLLSVVLPFALGPAMVGLGLFDIGCSIRSAKNKWIFPKLLDLKWYFWIVLTLGTSALIFLNGYINMRSEKYAIVPLFFVVSMLSFFVLITLSKFICKIFGKTIICSWLKSIGENSIVYVCTNQVVIIVVRYLTSFLPETSTLMLLVKLLFTLVLSLTFLWCISLFIAKTPARMLIGRFNTDSTKNKREVGVGA